MKTVETAKVLSLEFLTENICDLWLECPKTAENAKAGQFAEIYPDNGINLLARPISICETGENKLRFVFRIVGRGTELFSRLQKGDKIRLLGPCGNGFDLVSGKRTLFVGGGIGIPPLLEACKRTNGNKTAVLGFAEGSFLDGEFKKTGARVYISTDDGSVGFKGNAVQLLEKENIDADVIYACGPYAMLKFLSLWAEKRNIKCFVSTEERMACGIGACVGCAIEIKQNGTSVYKKVCKDGPVFDSREVVWR